MWTNEEEVQERLWLQLKDAHDVTSNAKAFMDKVRNGDGFEYNMCRFYIKQYNAGLINTDQLRLNIFRLIDLMTFDVADSIANELKDLHGEEWNEMVFIESVNLLAEHANLPDNVMVQYISYDDYKKLESNVDYENINTTTLLNDLLVNYLSEYDKCIEIESYHAALLMAGFYMECALMLLLLNNGVALGDIKRQPLGELIKTCNEKSLLNTRITITRVIEYFEIDVIDLCESIKGIRNTIHPENNCRTLRYIIDRNQFEIAFDRFWLFRQWVEHKFTDLKITH